MSSDPIRIEELSIWDIRSFYTSSFIKIKSSIRKIKISQFSHFPTILVSPSNSPNVTGSGWDLKWELQSTRSNSPNVTRSGWDSKWELQNKNTSFFLTFSNYSPLPTPPKSGSVPVMSVTHLGILLILHTKFHPDLSALNVFRDFRSLPLPPWHWIRSGSKIRDLSYEVLLNMKFH